MTTLSPNISLLSKIGNIAQILDDAIDPSKIDFSAARKLLADREVSQWLDRMYDLGLLNRQEDE